MTARLGAVLTGLFPGSVSDSREAVRGVHEGARLGFGVAELYYEGPGFADLCRACRDSGLATIYHAAFPLKQQKLDLGDADPARRRTAVDLGRGWIDRARDLGSDTVMFLSGPSREEPRERDLAAGLLAESLGSLCEHASGAGLSVHLEYFNDKGEPWLLMGPTARCLDLARSVASAHPNFGLTFDLSHVLQMGEDPLASLLSIRHYCRHLHMANCVIRDRTDPLFGDKHPPFGRQGGEVDGATLAGFLRGAAAAGFFEGREVTLSVEVITRAPADPVPTTDEAHRAMREALADAGLGAKEER